jgi:hypothetical protein
MKVMTQTIEKLYTYDEREFMPIFEGDRLVNKGAFVRYKIKSAIEKSEAKRCFAEFLDAFDQAVTR